VLQGDEIEIGVQNLDAVIALGGQLDRGAEDGQLGVTALVGPDTALEDEFGVGLIVGLNLLDTVVAQLEGQHEPAFVAPRHVVAPVAEAETGGQRKQHQDDRETSYTHSNLP